MASQTIYKCPDCQYNTTNKPNPAQSCCGRKRFKCPNCGQSRMTAAGFASASSTPAKVTGTTSSIFRIKK